VISLSLDLGDVAKLERRSADEASGLADKALRASTRSRNLTATLYHG
jgi:hypothetical protein